MVNDVDRPLVLHPLRHVADEPVVADDGPAPVVDLGLDLGVVLVAVSVVAQGLAEDGVTVAHESDLDVAGVLRGVCKIGIISHTWQREGHWKICRPRSSKRKT